MRPPAPFSSTPLFHRRLRRLLPAALLAVAPAIYAGAETRRASGSLRLVRSDVVSAGDSVVPLVTRPWRLRGGEVVGAVYSRDGEPGLQEASRSIGGQGCLCPDGQLFSDGFETGDVTVWSAASP